MPLPPPQIPPPRRMPAWAVGALMAMALMGLLTMTRLAWALTEPIPIVAAETSPQTLVLDFSGMPTAQPFPSVVSMVILPTATPAPRPTVASLPTLAPLVCGVGSGLGDVCVWPAFTPTPDPGPPMCVTPVPKEACEWRGWPRVTTGDS